ncbi:hypothetical protein EYU44_18655 [Vibrio cholerae]|nr:hypothetical protein [Vibrio cholerae]
MKATEMKVGREYRVTRKGSPLIDYVTMPDGEVIQIGPFEDESYNVRILEKPAMVSEVSEKRERLIRIPKHLKSENWYAVLNLDTNQTHFLCAKDCQIEEIK